MYCASSFSPAAEADTKTPDSIFDFEVVTITGETRKLSDYQGKVCLIVNVASK
jgi:hypothetical protein